MTRGILAGGFWGIVTALVGLSLASLMGPQPAGNSPPLPPQVEAPSVASDRVDPAEGAGVLPEVLPEVGGAAQPSGAEGAAATGNGIAQPPLVEAGSLPAELADTSSAPVPEAAQSTVDGAAPLPGGGEGPVAPGGETPVRTAPRTAAPQTPLLEAPAIAETTPAEPRPAPPAEEATLPEEAGLTEAAPAPALIEAAEPELAEPDPAELQTGGPELAAAPPQDPASQEAPLEAAPPSALPMPPAAEEEAPPIAATALFEPAEVADAPSDVPSNLPGPDSADPPTGPAPESAQQPAPQDEDEGPAAPARITLGTGQALPGANSTVRVNRPETPSGGAGGAEAELPAVDDPEAPALVRYAASVEGEEPPAPHLSIIVIDPGTMEGGLLALTGLSFPVTVALDPGQPGAAERMRGYRDAGFEVLALARLPAGAQPSDVEIALEGGFSVLPEAIGLLDAGEGGLQANAAVAAQAMDRLAADGRAVVSLAQGLNMIARAAEAADVPAALVLRDLDSDGQEAAAIRRALDQAAFNARRDGSAVLLARLRPNTVSALILWGGTNRAGGVEVVPLSVQLLSGAAEDRP